MKRGKIERFERSFSDWVWLKIFFFFFFKIGHSKCSLSFSVSYFIQTHSVWKSPIMSHLNFLILAFSTNFYPITTDLSGNTVWPQTSGFKKLTKLTIFGISNERLSTQNVNVARFARNVEWDFFCDFQTLYVLLVWVRILYKLPPFVELPDSNLGPKSLVCIVNE